MLPLRYGLIQHPSLLLITRNSLDELLPHVPLERVSLSNYQIPLKRWTLIPLSCLWLFGFLLLQFFSPCLVLQVDCGDKHLSPYNNLIRLGVHWNNYFHVYLRLDLDSPLEHRGFSHVFPTFRNNLLVTIHIMAPHPVVHRPAAYKVVWTYRVGLLQSQCARRELTAWISYPACKFL